nr:uncharacterized protein LOC117681274 [Crassostrea gigas]
MTKFAYIRQYCERYDKACCKRNTNASTMMHLNECILFLALLTIVAKCNPKEQEKKLSARVAGSTESNTMLYILDQLYAMKSNVQQLENEMKIALTSCERRIQFIENRKETRCISGTVGHAGFQPTAKWPYSQRIDFNSPFDATPTVTYGLYALDSSDEANLRVSTLLSNVSSTGFQLTLRTWSDSKLFEAAVSWMACGK